MPVAAFPLCMSTQDENVSNVLRLTCPQSSLFNLSIAAGKVWYRKKDAKKRNPLFSSPFVSIPATTMRVTKTNYTGNVSDAEILNGIELPILEEGTARIWVRRKDLINTLLLPLYLTRKGRKLFGLTLNSHLCQTVHCSLSFQGRFLQLFILCL